MAGCGRLGRLAWGVRLSEVNKLARWLKLELELGVKTLNTLPKLTALIAYLSFAEFTYSLQPIRFGTGSLVQWLPSSLK
jgi:hypothetical protein